MPASPPQLQSIAESQSRDSSNSSEGEEPWDVQRAHSEDSKSNGNGEITSKDHPTMRKQQRRHDNNNNDDDIGDLPALSLSRSGDEGTNMKRVLSGQRTLRPLSPPSEAGLPSKQQQQHQQQQRERQRRAQQDRDDSEDEETDDGEEEDDDEDVDDDDMPMDERADRRQQRREDALSCMDEDVLGLNTNLCDYTLNAMGEICGVVPSSSNPNKKSLYADPSQPPRKSPPLELPKRSTDTLYGVDEQTAIEVEYVEPMISSPSSLHTKSDGSSTAAASSPRRKNAMLKAIAQRAKDDFQSNTKSTRGGSKEGTPSATSPPDNVYSSFNPSEKRKFLKLINSGLTPTDATSQVLQERADGEKAMDQVGEGSSSKTPKGRLAFWKKTKDGDEVVPKEIAPPPSGETVEGNDNDDDETRFAKSGINYYDAVRKEPTGETDLDESTDDDDTEDQDDEVAAVNRARKSKKSKNILSKFAKVGFSPLEKQQSGSPDKQQRPRGLFTALSGRGQSPKHQQQQQQQQHEEEEIVVAPHDLGPTILAAQEQSKEEKDTPRSPQTPKSVEELKAMAPPRPPSVQPLSPPKTDVVASTSQQQEEQGNESVVPRGGGGQQHHVFKPIPVKAEAQQQQQQQVLAKVLSGDSQDSLFQDDPKLLEEKKEDVSEDEDDGYYDDDDIEEHIKAQLLGTSPARSAALSSKSSTPSKSSREGGTSMELSMPLNLDAYLNSTELMSNYGGGSVQDHLSVVSSKSYKTSGTMGTTGTNYTTSTRSRRPGAAKQRLAAQKKAESKVNHKSGWQESIQAAAAGAGRVWDPVKGWIDYVDPNVVVDSNPENRSEEKIHIPLDRVKRTQPEPVAPETTSSGEPVSVPFPAKWEQERNAMLQGTSEMDRVLMQAQSQDPSSPVRKLTPSANPISPRISSVPPANPMPPISPHSKPPLAASSPASPLKARGWVETMKAATANINKDGKRWDPEKGWVGLDDSEEATEVDVGSSRYADGSISVQLESDTHDFGMAAAPQTTAPPENNKPNPPNKGDLLKKAPSEDSADDSESNSRLGGASTKSGKSGRYIQIGDTGSVKSHYRGSSGKAKSSPPPVATLSSTPEKEPETPENKEVFGKLDEARREHDAAKRSADPTQRPSLLVNVVKEKVDPADASLFPPQNSARGGRGNGPVDLDKIYDEENATFDEGQVNFSWDTDSNMSSPPPKQEASSSGKGGAKPVVPKLKINVRDISSRDGSTPGVGQLSNKSSDSRPRGERSFDSVSSTGNKSIPKLRGPKRDTSPIRGRRSTKNKQVIPAPLELVSVEKTQYVSALSQPELTEEFAYNSEELSGPAIGEMNPGRRISAGGPSPPLPRGPRGSPPAPQRSPPAPQRSVPSRHNLAPPMPEHPIKPQSTPRRSPGDDEKEFYTADLSPKSPGGSTVKLKAEYWESRTSGSSPGDTDGSGEVQEMPSQAAEWKSFLAKKVQAETAAAAKQQGSQRANSEFDRDSLFDFPESEGAFPTASRLANNQMRLPPGGSNQQHRRPLHNRADMDQDGRADMPHRNRDHEPHPGAFDDISDLSPIRKQEEEEEEEDDDDGAPSETSSFAVQPTSFLQRLQACAAPIMPRNSNGEASCDATSLPLAHLAFLKTNPSVNGTSPEKARFVPPNLCGRPDIIHEEVEEEDESDYDKQLETRQKEEKPRSRSNPRSSRQSGDVSSVISDEAFGAKTAYLESIAMKAAVSGSKKKRRSTGSDTSGSSSKHSEKWQRFLDKKGGSGGRSSEDKSSNEEVSRAAEKYAAEKVEEMMELMAQRSQPTEFKSRPMEEATGGFPVLEKHARYDVEQRKSDSARAAEDLAAARVEAMMQTLSSHNLDEGEI